MQLVVTNDEGDSLLIQRNHDLYIVTIQTMEGDSATVSFDRVDWDKLISRVDAL